MGLAKLLQSWDLQPDVVLGHSVGQYAAACVAGMMSWDDGLHLISERGRLIGELPAGGSMLAVFATVDIVKQAIESAEDDFAGCAQRHPYRDQRTHGRCPTTGSKIRGAEDSHARR